MLGIDPQLDAPGAPGIPQGYTLTRFCCEIVEACARSAIAVKPQLAFYEARGIDGMRAFCEVVKTARRLGLITIADAKRGDIGTTSAAYAEAFLGDGDFNCDAVTVNPYQGATRRCHLSRRSAQGAACSCWSRPPTHPPASSRIATHPTALSGKRWRRASKDGVTTLSANRASARSARSSVRLIPSSRDARAN